MKELLKPVKVMIAGVGGASLGTEIYKALKLATGYEIYGCDISSTAYGLYEKGFTKTYLVSKKNYVSNVINVCLDAGIQFLIPGGEQPMTLIGTENKRFAAHGIKVLSNTPEVTLKFSNKDLTFKQLEKIGIPIPRTISVRVRADLEHVGLPCIIKPSTGSGGSEAVFFAVNSDEAMIYADFIMRNGNVPIAQEYIGDDEGEFTIGVLSSPNKKVIGSVALRRSLDAKFSVSYRGRGGLISSGYSQGYIDDYSDLCEQAERIAFAIESRGPINVQGRVRDGILLPFEINPRFSASTHLRALAGFNEVDTLIKYYLTGKVPSKVVLSPGWYLRSLTEQYIPKEQIK